MDDLSTDLPVDDAALFASVTGSEPAPAVEPAKSPAIATVPEITSSAAPAAQAAEPVIPPSRLREESEARRAAERERDEFKARLDRLERAQPTAPKPVDTPKKEIWDGPDDFVDGKLQTALTPVQEQVRSVVLYYSRRDANTEYGAEKVEAAENALKQAIASGRLNGSEVTGRLQASLDPVGDVMKWHLREANQQMVGDDPQAWLKSEIDKLKADPVFQAEMIALAQGTATNGGASVVERPQSAAIPSLRTIGSSPASASSTNAPSDAELFASTTSRRRRA